MPIQFWNQGDFLNANGVDSNTPASAMRDDLADSFTRVAQQESGRHARRVQAEFTAYGAADVGAATTTWSQSLVEATTNHTLRFKNPDGRVIGELDMSGPELMFTGELRPSAEAFLGACASVWKREIDRRDRQIAALEAQIQVLKHNAAMARKGET